MPALKKYALYLEALRKLLSLENQQFNITSGTAKTKDTFILFVNFKICKCSLSFIILYSYINI